MHALLNIVGGIAIRLYERFGWWTLIPPGAIVILVGVMVVRGWSVNSDIRSHAGASADDYKKLVALRQEEDDAEHHDLQVKQAKPAVPPKPPVTQQAIKGPVVPVPGATVPPTNTVSAPAPANPQPVGLAAIRRRPLSYLTALLCPSISPCGRRTTSSCARIEGDPRLAEAVVALGRRTAGNWPRWASWLPCFPTAHASVPQSLAQPVIFALAANGTPEAHAQLRELVRTLAQAGDRACCCLCYGHLRQAAIAGNISRIKSAC